MTGGQVGREVAGERALVFAHENSAGRLTPEQYLAVIGVKRGRASLAYTGRVNRDSAPLVVPLKRIP